MYRTTQGAAIELELRGRIMTTTGVVAWNKPIVDQADDPLFSLGVQLDRITESARIKLRSIIREGT